MERDVLVSHCSDEIVGNWSRELRAGHSAMRMVGWGLLVWQATILQWKAWHWSRTGCLRAHEQQFDIVKHAIVGPFFIIAKLATIMLRSMDVLRQRLI